MLPSPLTSRYFISPGSRLYFAASSASSNPQVPSCIYPIKVLTGSPSRIILPAPPPCTPPPVWISDPPCNFKTLLRLMVKLKLVVQKKSGVEILWVVRESSIPLFSIFPIFSVTVAYPLDLGTGRLSNISREIRRYKSTSSEIALFNRPSSSPKSTCSLVSHFKSGLASLDTPTPVCLAPLHIVVYVPKSASYCLFEF